MWRQQRGGRGDRVGDIWVDLGRSLLSFADRNYKQSADEQRCKVRELCFEWRLSGGGITCWGGWDRVYSWQEVLQREQM